MSYAMWTAHMAALNVKIPIAQLANNPSNWIQANAEPILSVWALTAVAHSALLATYSQTNNNASNVVMITVLTASMKISASNANLAIICSRISVCLVNRIVHSVVLMAFVKSAPLGSISIWALVYLVVAIVRLVSNLRSFASLVLRALTWLLGNALITSMRNSHWLWLLINKLF